MKDKVKVISPEDWYLNKINDISAVVYDKLSYSKFVEVIVRSPEDDNKTILTALLKRLRMHFGA